MVYLDRSPVADMNLPLPGEKGPVALLKLYDDAGETLKLNEVVEVVAVVSIDPSLSHMASDDE